MYVYCYLQGLTQIKKNIRTLKRKFPHIINEFRSSLKIFRTLAAPVELGMMFCAAPRPPRQSFIEGPSTVFCVAEQICTKQYNRAFFKCK
ncbi:hypothetical protein HanIR_Chr11g0520951 [Helianthus annuus]|nr:hypothetical protein HanIR_Chr11g0520951 [Helianthus annuus]